jgi:hypothetical protein
MVRPMKRSLTTGALIALLCSFALAQKADPSGTMSLNSIIDGLEKKQTAQFSYEVIREYRLFGTDTTKANSEVIAKLVVKRPEGSDYNIQQASGSSRGQQIIRAVLDHEIEVISTHNEARMALTRNNYDFTYIGEAILDGQPCYRVGLKPKRKDKELVSGEAWIDKRSFSIRQVQGEVARTPSWWLRSVHVKLIFAEVKGAWLQTSMEAVADVRIVGLHTLTSRIRDYHADTEVASIILAPLHDRKH